MQNQVTFLPRDVTFGVYKLILNRLDIGMGFMNSIKYTVTGTLINVIMTSMGAFALSRKECPHRNFFMMLLTFTMFFSGGLIPIYLVVRSLGLMNSIGAIVLPTAVSTFNLIIVRTFFQQIPDSLSESALMDGASHRQIMIKIIMPLSKPVLATITLFYAVGHWNSFFPALIYLTDNSKWPIQLLVRYLVIEGTQLTEVTQMGLDGFFPEEMNIQDWTLWLNIKYAVVFVTAAPIIIIYPFIQRYFVKGVMIGAIKA
jgi:putative aldouronate transport system permease protein